jgi:hypothetical protein
MDEIKKKHKNQHEWCWMPEFGSYFQWCDLCHRCERIIGYSEDKKYYTHKQAVAIVLELIKNHPADCDCEICSPVWGGKEALEHYKKYYKLD